VQQFHDSLVILVGGQSTGFTWSFLLCGFSGPAPLFADGRLNASNATPVNHPTYSCLNTIVSSNLKKMQFAERH
jgi:hypothetical protein